MQEHLGDILASFDDALGQFRLALTVDEPLEELVFEDCEDWQNLLQFKLVPHLAGEGCLIAAIAGGTNTGKSTLFNLLLGEWVSPPVMTAAATRHPVLAANGVRAAQCLDGKLVPEFKAQAFDDPDAAVSADYPEETLFVAEIESLPERLVLLDTPDVDSIEQANWDVAENIRAVGDVLVAVLTAEKYRDDRVVEFFKKAKTSGRVVIPVMNKANPAKEFEVARKQLEEFCGDTGIEGPCFVVAHDFELEDRFDEPIRSLDDDGELRGYLESLDVAAIKEEVFRNTVTHFVEQAGAFVNRAEEVGERLRRVAQEFEGRTKNFASKYDPEPGAEIGGLFHEYVQARRGPVRRTIGTASSAVARGAAAVGRTLLAGFRKRATLDVEEDTPTDDDIRRLHTQQLDRLSRDLATNCIESIGNIREPASHLMEAGFEDLDLDEAVEEIIVETIRSESISEEFRAHARKMLDTWWNDHKGRRRVLEGLDTVLAIMPAAIAAPISIYTGGVGVPEAVVFIGPLAEQFVARVVEYQFGDAMFDFLSPWKEEQQTNFENGLRDHLVGPGLKRLYEMLEVFEGGHLETLKDLLEQCQET